MVTSVRNSQYDDDRAVTAYLWGHYTQLFTPAERKAYWAVFAHDKASAAITEFVWRRYKLADDPEVMGLLSDGLEVFRHRAAQRVLREHGDKVFLNRCARCSRVVRTPQAQQCLWCGFDWHPRQVPAHQ